IGRASPTARSRLQAPYIGSLRSADQIASVANSQDATFSERSFGQSRFTAPTATPGIINKTAWLTGTVHGKSLAHRNDRSGFTQSFLKRITPRARKPPQRPNEIASRPAPIGESGTRPGSRRSAVSVGVESIGAIPARTSRL